MLTLSFLAIAVVFLAFSNGANDNFKGVATLYGSAELNYRQALVLASIAQLLGSLASVLLASSLVKAFSGAGLVDASVAASTGFLLPVALAAGATVILATRFGLPISTTHALIGALAGAGWVLAADSLQWRVLAEKFFAPLLLSPLIAIVLTMGLYAVLTRTRKTLKIGRESCVCILQSAPAALTDGQASALVDNTPGMALIGGENCRKQYVGYVAGISIQNLVRAGHLSSAFALCFARALNDTPKLIGLIVVWQALNVQFGMVVIALAMLLGGVLGAAKVASTMSQKISAMHDGQALTANFVSAVLVIAASRYGLPVSTTHVTVSAITGIGLSNGSADFSALRKIVASWLMTLPIAAVLAGILAWFGG